MSFLEVAASFTIAKNPSTEGRYVVFSPVRRGSISSYDRVQLFCFVNPPHGFDEDVMFESSGTWTLGSAHIIDILLDHRDDLPIFTIVEKKNKYCRLIQIGGERQVRDVNSFWFSIEMLNRAIAHGTLELLS